MSIVLVAGGTGNVGRWVVRELRALGCKVCIVTRDFSKAKALFKNDDGVLIRGIKNPAAPGAFEDDDLWTGVRTVVSCLGVRIFTSGEGPIYKATVNLLQAAKRRNIKRWLHVSAAMITKPTHPIVFFVNALGGLAMHWHLKVEEKVRASGIPYTIVRPVGLNTTASKQVTMERVVIGQGDNAPGWEVSVHLVAHVAVEALFGTHQMSTVDRTFELSGDFSKRLPKDWSDCFTKLRPDDPLPKISHAQVYRKIQAGLFAMFGVLACLVLWWRG